MVPPANMVTGRPQNPQHLRSCSAESDALAVPRKGQRSPNGGGLVYLMYLRRGNCISERSRSRVYADRQSKLSSLAGHLPTPDLAGSTSLSKLGRPFF